MPRTAARRVWTLAVVVSFAIYLVPIIGPHGFWLLGEILVRDLGRLADGEQPLWAAVNAGVALSLQLAALALGYWILAAGGWRWLVVLVAAPLALWATQVLYLIIIPTHFLIEDQTAAERGDWPVACEIAGASLLDVRAGVQLELARAGEAWIVQESVGRYDVLTMPGCRVSASGLDRGIANAVDRVAPGGAALFRSQDRSSGGQQYWFSAGDGSAPRSLGPPTEKWWGPVLSRHADVIAWIESERAGSRGFIHRIVVRDLNGGDEQRVSLDGDLWAHPYLLSVDTTAGEIVLATGFDKIVAVDLAGDLKWGPVEVGGFRNIQENFRRQADGWVVWDGYREEGRYRVHWSLPRGQGRHEIPKGRGINGVAVDPSGRYIAVSVSTTLSIGSIRDAVYVLRVQDGTEVYRRYLDRYTRTPVAFIGAHFLAFTRYDSIVEGVGGRVQVLRVPDPAETARESAAAGS